MGKIDKAKEYISILKVYMGIVIALMIGDISGTVRLFNADQINLVFWLGIITVIILSLIFLKLAKYVHKKIDELEEIE